MTRVFSKQRDMFVAGATTVQPLLAFVTLYRGQSKTFETPPLAMTESIGSRLNTALFKLSICLAKLPLEKELRGDGDRPTGQMASYRRPP